MITPNTKYYIPNTSPHHFCGNKSGVGFTLVESMVAISILLIAVVGPMSTIGGSLSQIRIARDQIIAVSLAQEGIEVMRQKRDSNSLQRWKEGSSNWTVSYVASNATTAWSIGLIAGNYVVTAPILSFVSSAVQPVYQENASGMYYQFTGAPVPVADYVQTKFSRVVNIADILPNEKKVTSTVTWTSVGGVLKQIQVSESIFGISL